MHFRLVKAMQRKGTRFAHFNQRIPTDLRERLIGTRLEVPIGDELVPLTITPQMAAVRLSLRTAEPGEIKRRQAGVIAYLETVYSSLRQAVPLTLSHREAVALAGELYRGWSREPAPGERISLTHTPTGWLRDDHAKPSELAAEYESVLAHIGYPGDEEEPPNLEELLGPIADRLLLRRGIAVVAGPSREVLLSELLAALRQGIAVRKKNAEGDYSPDPMAQRFPDWVPPESAPGSRPKVSLNGLVEEWWIEAKSAGRSLSTMDAYRKPATPCSTWSRPSCSHRLSRRSGR